MLTQREYDIRQSESELRMQMLFDKWRRSFLAERFQQPPQQQAAVNPPLIPEKVESDNIR